MHEFEVREEISLDATPEQVWQAIATGPGIDSWFMGRNEVEGRAGGRVRQTMMGQTDEATITAWEPGRHLAYRSDPEPDGRFMAFEYLIEGREGGSTVLRFVHNGFLGDDWEAEYDALREGDGMYLRKLAAYVEHFSGRFSTFNLFEVGPQVPDKDLVRRAFAAALGLSGTPAVRDPIRLSVGGVAPAEGVVAFVSPSFLGARTDTGLYTLIHGYRDTVVVEYHHFTGPIDQAATEKAWRSWLGHAFA